MNWPWPKPVPSAPTPEPNPLDILAKLEFGSATLPGLWGLIYLDNGWFIDPFEIASITLDPSERQEIVLKSGTSLLISNDEARRLARLIAQRSKK